MTPWVTRSKYDNDLAELQAQVEAATVIQEDEEGNETSTVLTADMYHDAIQSALDMEAERDTAQAELDTANETIATLRAQVTELGGQPGAAPTSPSTDGGERQEVKPKEDPLAHLANDSIGKGMSRHIRSKDANDAEFMKTPIKQK